VSRPAAPDLPPDPSIVPELSRASALFLFAQSGAWTALVALNIVGIVWLVGGPVLTAWAWFVWAIVRQRGRVGG
jgi:hypothetical protein